MLNQVWIRVDIWSLKPAQNDDLIVTVKYTTEWFFYSGNFCILLIFGSLNVSCFKCYVWIVKIFFAKKISEIFPSICNNLDSSKCLLYTCLLANAGFFLMFDLTFEFYGPFDGHQYCNSSYLIQDRALK